MKKPIFRKEDVQESVVRFSIKNKILMLAAGAALPFLILAVILLLSMTNYSRTYDQIVSSMTIANNYNLNFKEEVDESLYKLVVGYIAYEDIHEDETLKDPYLLIGDLRDDFTRLIAVTTEPESRVWLENLNRNIDTLEKRVDDVLENIRIGGRYDENIEKLDNNIYILTELIQENIQYYIYYQTRSMEEVNENLHRRIQSFIIICGVLAALLAAAVIAVTFFVTSGILRPIKVLYDATQKIAKGDFDAHAEVNSNDEIETLAHSFNDMAEKIQTLITKTKEDEQRMRWLDLRLLQEQINPHFLYNTLNTISSIASLSDIEEIAKISDNLSSMFQYNIKGDDIVPVKRELQHVKNYLEIQAIRFPDKYRFSYEISPEIEQEKMLKFLLQPLVENSLQHAFHKMKRVNTVSIIASEDGDDIVFRILDNGVGMSREQEERLNQELAQTDTGTLVNHVDKGIGLRNVNVRIKNLYGKNYGIQVKSQEGSYTEIQIRIRKLEKEEGEEKG